MASAWSILRDARYALPRQVERLAPAPGVQAAARMVARLERRGLLGTVGYFNGGEEPAAQVAATDMAVCQALGGAHGHCLAVKAPPLGFSPAHLHAIAQSAQAAGIAMVFDAHGPDHAQATLDAVEALLPGHPGTGCALPARWQRSMADAARFRDSSARLRLVKGEWADPQSDPADIPGSFLALAAALAGRAAPVAVATHDPALARAALELLLAAGTPCELEQLRGLPRRRTRAVARKLGVPVRVYVPFGPGWWPYAVDKALARPYLPIWALKDWVGRD